MAIDFEEDFSKNFLEGCKRDGISIEYPELKNRKYRANYDHIIEEIMKSNPIEDNKNYKKLKRDEIIYRAIVIVKYLLGDAVSNDELLEASNLIETTDSEFVMNGYCLDITDRRDGRRFNVLNVPGMNKTMSVVCLVGIFIHYLERKKGRFTYDNYQHTFVMSYLAEAVAADFMDKEDASNDLLNKLRGIRLDAIKFQRNSEKEVDETLKIFPFIRHVPDFESIYAYERSRNHAFLIGFINQVCLLNRYLEDDRVMLSKLNEVYKGNLKVPELLNYYGLDLKKHEIADEVIEVVKKYR